MVLALISLCTFVAKAGDTATEILYPSQLSSEEGKRIVETFGEESMPNWYARYEKARDTALELEQVFKETFPQPIGEDDAVYSAYQKLLLKMNDAREKFRIEIENLAYFYFRVKAGVLTSEKLAASNELSRYSISFPGFVYAPIQECKKLEAKQEDFAEKFMPSTYSQFQSFV